MSLKVDERTENLLKSLPVAFIKYSKCGHPYGIVKLSPKLACSIYYFDGKHGREKTWNVHLPFPSGDEGKHMFKSFEDVIIFIEKCRKETL